MDFPRRVRKVTVTDYAGEWFSIDFLEDSALPGYLIRSLLGRPKGTEIYVTLASSVKKRKELLDDDRIYNTSDLLFIDFTVPRLDNSEKIAHVKEEIRVLLGRLNEWARANDFFNKRARGRRTPGFDALQEHYDDGVREVLAKFAEKQELEAEEFRDRFNSGWLPTFHGGRSRKQREATSKTKKAPTRRNSSRKHKKGK